VTEPAELRGDQWRTSATVVGAIPRLLGTALWVGADLVIGSRYAPGGSIDSAWGIHRRYLSPIHLTDHAAGQSKMDFRVKVESALRPWRLR
jgi:hydrogenase maturation factor HypE